MTEHQNGKRSWGAKQNWIKDALTKSGTELVDVSRSKTKAAQKKQQTSAKGKSRESSRNVAQEGGEKVCHSAPAQPHTNASCNACAILFWYTHFFSLDENNKQSEKAREGERERKAGNAGFRA